MTKWQYMKGFYYTKNERSKGAFSSAETHPYLKIGDGSESKLYKDDNVQLVLDDLGRGGWELVSTTPIIGQQSLGIAGLFAVDPGGASVTKTQGVMLWFKRLLD